MGLRERLGRLTGAAPPPAETGGSLARRVARLRPGGAGPVGQCARGPDEQALVESLGAERLAPGVLCCERLLSGGERQGIVTLDEGRIAVPELTDIPPGDPTGWLFLDTETSGLAGGTGTWVFQVGILRYGTGGWRLRQYLLARLDSEPQFLEAVAGELQGANLVVTYNGKTFDGPLLATRFRLVGRPSPLDEVPHLDLLARVRRAFASVWPDCRLASAEERLLRFRRQGDLPGAAAPQAWLDWLRHGRMTALAAVARHNRWDLLSLAALPAPLATAYRDPAATGAKIQTVAAHHLARGAAERALAILTANLARLTPPALRMLAELHRRRGEWEPACRIWSDLAEGNDPLALEHLAKYHEHRRGDPATALTLAARLPQGPSRDRRCARLSAKLGHRVDKAATG